MKEGPEVKSELLLPNTNKPAWEVLPMQANKEENIQTNLTTDVKEEGYYQIQIKPEAPQLESDITYNDSVKLELLHEELDLKTEILSNHEEQTVNEAVDNKLFKCSECSYACTNKSNFRRHLKIHTGERPFKCAVCGYACPRNDDLKRHMITHTGEKPFKCRECGYACTRNHKLKIHMKTHLRRHVKIHAGEKSFQCSVCGYAFIQNGDLKRHMKTHTGEKPFKCVVCGYACVQSNNFKRHMKTH